MSISFFRENIKKVALMQIGTCRIYPCMSLQKAKKIICCYLVFIKVFCKYGMLWNHSNSTNNSNSIQYRVFRKYRLRTWDFLRSHRKDIQFQNLKYYKAFPKKVSQEIFPKIFSIRNISGYLLKRFCFQNSEITDQNH